MTDTATRLQALEDRAEIAQLVASYGLLADSGDAQRLAMLWTMDGKYAVGGFGSARGHSQIAALIEGEAHRALMSGGCAHVLSPHTIALHGDAATARGYSVVFRRNGEGFEAWRVSANRWHFVRTEAGWRVTLRENAPLDGSAAARALLETTDDT